MNVGNDIALFGRNENYHQGHGFCPQKLYNLLKEMRYMDRCISKSNSGQTVLEDKKGYRHSKQDYF